MTRTQSKPELNGAIHTSEELVTLVNDPIFQAAVAGIQEALAKVQIEKAALNGLSATLAAEAMAFRIAVYSEAHPEVQTKQQMRLTGEGMGKLIHQFMIGFRRMYEETGERQMERLGVFSTPPGALQ